MINILVCSKIYKNSFYTLIKKHTYSYKILIKITYFLCRFDQVCKLTWFRILVINSFILILKVKVLLENKKNISSLLENFTKIVYLTQNARAL